MTKHKHKICITKQFYTPSLFKNLIGLRKENIINRANFSGLR